MSASTVSSTTPLTGTWVVDPNHTTIEFRVKHIGLARVRGVFHRFDGAVIVREDGEISASGTVAAASLDTRVAARDDHLRSVDFFDVDNHPQISFAATSVEKMGEEGLRVVGDLTVRGVTQTVELTGDILGIGIDDDGMSRIGLDVAGVLDRRDFGLTWNKAVDGGGLLVGNRVDVRLEVSAVRRP